MSVKSLSIVKLTYGPLMKALAFAILQPECRWRLSRENHKRRRVRLLTQQTRSSIHLCVKQHTVFFLVC